MPRPSTTAHLSTSALLVLMGRLTAELAITAAVLPVLVTLSLFAR